MNRSCRSSPTTKKAGVDPTLLMAALENAAKFGIIGGIGGAGMGAVMGATAARPGKPYDPRKALERLGRIANIGPSGTRLDVPYPVLKTNEKQASPDPNDPVARLEIGTSKAVGGLAGRAQRSVPPTEGLKVPSLGDMAGWASDKLTSMSPRLTDGSASGLAALVPSTLLPLFGGAYLGYSMGNRFMSPDPKPLSSQKDTEYLKEELGRARNNYRLALLEQHLDKVAPPKTKLAAAVDRLYEAHKKCEEKGVEKKAWANLLLPAALTAMGGKAVTDSWDPRVWWQSASGNINKAKELASAGTGLSTGLIATTAGLALPVAALLATRGLEKADPLKDPEDPTDQVVKAVKLRSRALAAGRGLPPVQVNPVNLDIQDEPTARPNSRFMNKTSGWEAEAEDFVEKVM